ncbi:MAG: protein TolA, partial [Desulfovibrionaceae bacterium]|nr:protein TolA [Desulfovibrionaceae bacterium]
MQALGWIFSIFLHLTVFLASLLFIQMEPVKFKLDVPVYEVELLTLGPPGLPPGPPGGDPAALPGPKQPGPEKLPPGPAETLAQPEAPRVAALPEPPADAAP